MLPIHIVGHAGCGKTTLIVHLIEALVKKNISVGTMKHSAHIHELDKPGKDSHRHRIAGAAPVAMVTDRMSAVYLPKSAAASPKKLLETYFSGVDIVLIEGWISGPFRKIEVWRDGLGKQPLFPEINRVCALVSDDAVEKGDLPLFLRSDTKGLLDFIENLSRLTVMPT